MKSIKFNVSIFLMLGPILILSNCASKQNIVYKGEKTINYVDLKHQISQQKFDDAILVIKSSKVSIDDKSGLTNLKANFIIYKDSAILVSVSNMLGIEIIKALVLVDSVKIIDRINKTYFEGGINELEKNYSMALNFLQLRNGLTGDYEAVLNNYSLINNVSVLSSKKGLFNLVFNDTTDVQKRSELILELDAYSYFTKRATYLLDDKKQEMEFLYYDFIKGDGYNFPGFIEFEFKNNKSEVKLAIQNKNIRKESFKVVKLEIPSGYQRKKVGN